MTGSEILELSIVIVVILISWPLVLTIMKRLGGWGALEECYPVKNISDGEKYRFSSIAFRKGKGLHFNYGSVITVTIGDRGIGIKTFFPFNLSHKPFFIPWTAVIDARRTKFMMIQGTALTIKEIDKTLIIWDFSGRKVFDAYKKHGIAMSPGSG